MLTVAIFSEVATAERPAVRVNQLGYLPGATLVSDATAPLDFVVTAGNVVWRGRPAALPRLARPRAGSTCPAAGTTPVTTASTW